MNTLEQSNNVGAVQRVNIDSEMRGAYLDYAMSVIVSRALPDVRDGLKPVHRRILYAMYDMGLRPDRAHKKSARIVGEVLGKYHPHGDTAVYDTMVRMAQDFSMRYQLVDGQGNFGSVDGDGAAAMRYTEARLTGIALELLVDIDRETVNFKENFDASLEEPEVLPARIPNLLLNGSGGIAVGMATNIPPHNLAEVCGAAVYLIDRWDDLDEVTLDDLMTFVKGPDFPTGGQILGTEGIKSAFATGRGRVIMRAKAEIEEMPRGGRFQIIIHELPYQVNKATLVEKIAELVNEDRLTHISDLRDESDRDGMRIVVELKKNAQPQKVLNQLYKYTQLQATFGVNTLALVEGSPRLLSLKQMLRYYIEHRQEVVRRRTIYDLAKAKARAHILEGLLKALDHLDAVIQTIRNSPSVDEALTRLMTNFDLSEIQARAILDMQLRRLAALERQKIIDEYRDLTAHIGYLEDLLADPTKILGLIREDLVAVGERYSDRRRTEIIAGGDGIFNEEDLIANIPLFITLTERGYVKRVPTETFRTQHRGGKGVTGMKTRDEDAVMQSFACMAHDDLLFFTDKGKVYHQKAHTIYESGRTAKGIPLINLLNMDGDERVTTIIPIHDWEKAGHFVLLTRQGRIKRVQLSEFRYVRASGLIAILLEGNDSLRWVKMTHGDDDLILVTAQGQSIRFHERDVRPMGRGTKGVMAIRLDATDSVAGLDIVREGADLLVITAKGYGKRTALSEYGRQGRHGKGIRTLSKEYEITGPIVEARVVQSHDEITLISADGMVIRSRLDNIACIGRATRGVRVMNLNDGDRVASLALLEERILNAFAQAAAVAAASAAMNGHSANGHDPNGHESNGHEE